MKRLFTGVLLLTLCLAVVALGQPKAWQFEKVFPDTGAKFNSGIHGLAVAPDGKIWVGIAGRSNSDSLPNGRAVVAIYVYNPDGTEASFSRIKVINTAGVFDTLTALNRGLRTAPDGNIAVAGGAAGNRMFKLNYHDGVGMLRVQPTANTSLIAPAFTSDGYMFTGHVVGGNPVQMWDDQFGAQGTAIGASLGFSRTMEVSKDGNDIYWCGYTTSKIYIYHSDLGTLGTYALTDSMAIGFQCESIAWNPKDGYLYASSGNWDVGAGYVLPPAPFTPGCWYAFDKTDKSVKDSIIWNTGAYPYNYTGAIPRPRGIAFSNGGDTAYVGCFNTSSAPIQMFVRRTVGVKPFDSNIPSGYTLTQNYPNPFNPTTEIQFAIPAAGFTTLKVYDLLGKEVATLVNEELTPGSYKLMLDGANLASGTYIYRLVSGSTQMTKKMMLLK